MNQEIWKDIIGYEGLYQISNLGRVKSLTRSFHFGPRMESVKVINAHIKKYSIDKGGYCKVLLSIDNKAKMCSVHRLVAKHFIHNPCNKEDVNHINGIKTDNMVDNLEWTTTSENLSHSFKIGLRSNKFGSNPRAKKVIDSKTGIVFDSVKTASIWNKIPHSTLKSSLNGNITNNTSFLYFTNRKLLTW